MNETLTAATTALVLLRSPTANVSARDPAVKLDGTELNVTPITSSANAGAATAPARTTPTAVAAARREIILMVDM